jgi:hypothetical protein
MDDDDCVLFRAFNALNSEARDYRVVSMRLKEGAVPARLVLLVTDPCCG